MTAYPYIGRMACFSMKIKKCFSRQDERPIEVSAWLMYLISKRFLKVRDINAFHFFSEVLICLYSEFSGYQHPNPCSALFNTALMLKTILFVLCLMVHCKQENHFCMEQMSFCAAKGLNFHTHTKRRKSRHLVCCWGIQPQDRPQPGLQLGLAGDTMLRSFEA